MTKQENLKLVFTGSNIEANFVKSILEDNNIGALVRNTLRESLTAGWVSGAPEDSSRVFVTEDHFEKSESLVKQYIDTREKT
ncbi:MAG: DUF2007 domain-containing protein [Bacteroidetes bacterium]|jgi:hypothetical protein|nr:DUF2007 domain-containing protein [Bacteroidota bacterium]MCK4361498.1 DUF2007 domain-containing protein [Bacteroidales bacterium]MCK4638949.1 DUF2007 domain-containing protein [Bacteroidales bacterium]